jgi:hypoxanthine phosphoribosyltransferase
MATDYVFISSTKAYDMAYELGKKVKESGFIPDCLVGISRGGLSIVRTLSDFFGIKNIYVIRVMYYDDIKTTKKEPKLIQDVDETFLKNKKVLVVDDVSDTGGSLIFTANLMKQKGIKEFKIATLHYKPWSKFKPDFYIDETDKWIIYPWEVGETIRLIMKRDMTREEKMKELRKTGIPTEMIKRYVDKFE